MALPLAIPLIGAAASALGGFLNYKSQKDTNEQNIALQRETNAQNKQMAETQMRFQENMSNTAHQREIADLKAAGLNPILSATGGGGASAPSGAVGTASAPSATAPVTGSMLSDSVNSGLSAMQLAQSIESASVQNQKTLADTAVSIEQAALTRSQAQKTKAEADYAPDLLAEDWQTKRAGNIKTGRESNFLADSYGDRLETIRQQAKQSALETRAQRSLVPVQEERAKYDKAAAGYDALIDRLQSAFDTASSGASLFRMASPASKGKQFTPQQKRFIEHNRKNR